MTCQTIVGQNYELGLGREERVVEKNQSKVITFLNIKARHMLKSQTILSSFNLKFFIIE